MGEKATPPKGVKGFKSVLVHPDLYKQLRHEALDEDQSLWERVHTVLCGSLGREDLMLQAPDPVSAR